MSNRDPVSVLLPTLEWSPVCDQLAAGLAPADELLVICDTEADPVAGYDPPDGVEILIAGAPEGCSGKANALAYGMERASNDRFVWTDDDFERDSEWLDRLVAAGERHGPATAIPFFSGRGWWRLVEPWHGALFTLLFYFQVGDVADTAWGGGVTFTRTELEEDVPTLAAELREVLSDDYLLTQRLPEVHAVRSMVTPVEVSGGFTNVVNRLIRFIRIVGVNEGWSGLFLNTFMAAVGILYPLLIAPILTIAFAAMYFWLELPRLNFIFAYPGLLVLPIVTIMGLLVSEFEWADRRYRLTGAGDVVVVESSDRRQ